MHIPDPHHHPDLYSAIAKAGKWLLSDAGLTIFTLMKQRLLENTGLSPKTINSSDMRILLDDYLRRFEEQLAQRVIERLDEDRLVQIQARCLGM